MKKQFACIAGLSLLAGCKKATATDGAGIPCDPQISYQNKVRPVFINNCTASGCHDGVNYPSLADFTVAHDAAAQIRSAITRGIMPPYNPLPAAEKAAIICWIDSGTKNN